MAFLEKLRRGDNCLRNLYTASQKNWTSHHVIEVTAPNHTD